MIQFKVQLDLNSKFKTHFKAPADSKICKHKKLYRAVNTMQFFFYNGSIFVHFNE